MSALGGTVPLALVERGGRVESVHHGAVAVVDADGALVGPAGLPAPVIDTLTAMLRATVRDNELRRRFATLGYTLFEDYLSRRSGHDWSE